MKVTAAALVMALLLAGCTNGESDAGTNEATSQAPATSTAPGSATVSGVVMSDEALPLAGASVGVTGLADLVPVDTNSEGVFVLTGIPPGSHSLMASKPGYVSAKHTIQAASDAVIDGIEIRLKPVQVPDVPYSLYFPDEAFVSCSATIPTVFETTATQPCGAEPNNDPAMTFPVDVSAGMVNIVLEMEWTPTTPATAQEMRQGLWKGVQCTEARCDADITFGEETGTSPIRRVYGSAAEPLRDDLSTLAEDTLWAIALVKRPKPVTEDPVGVSVVFQQPVLHHATVFYNGAAPEGYSATSDV